MCRVCRVLCIVRVRLTLFVSRCRSPPPEVVVLGSGSIVAYLGQLLRGQKPCYRLKLMFVGQENVGYTLFRLPPTLQIAHTDRTHTTRTTHTTNTTNRKTSLLRALQRTGQKVKGVSRVVKREDEISRTHAGLSSTIWSHRLISRPRATCVCATLCSHPHGAVVDGRDRHQRVEPAHGLRMGRRCAGG